MAIGGGHCDCHTNWDCGARGERSWTTDSRILTPQDAAECVTAYHQAYTRTRFAWLMRQAAGRGRGEAIDSVFRNAIPMD